MESVLDKNIVRKYMGASQPSIVPAIEEYVECVQMLMAHVN